MEHPFIYDQHVNSIQQNQIRRQIIQMPQLTQIISQLSQNCLYLKALKQAKRLYTINYNDLKTLSPYNVFQLLKKLNSKIESSFVSPSDPASVCESGNEECWFPSEFKLFSWVSVCYAFSINKEINEFKHHNLEFIASVFKKKKPIFIEYNLLCLQRQPKGKKQEWSQQEKNMFLDILKEDRFKGKWSDISYNLYCRSDQQFFRTSHNCREMWYNHLNPVVNHEKWTIEEDVELFRLASQLGTKWARISKALNGVRTEHMVKNRFNSISKKYYSRFQRCSTKKMIELIGIHLQKKLNSQKQMEQSANSRQNDVNSQSEPSLKKEESIIEEEEEEREEHEELEEKGEITEEQCKKEEAEPTAIEQEVKEEMLLHQEVEQDNIKMETIESQRAVEEQWEAIKEGGCRLQLIDYMDYYPQQKQTIFSGTNS